MKHHYTVARNTFFQEKIKNEKKYKNKQKTHTHTKFIVVLMIMMLMMIKLVEPINELPQYLD